MVVMKKILAILLLPVFIFSEELEYSLQDYNTTSPTYGLNVWEPEYLGYITLHYFSSQGWAGWTSTFGQLSNFQDELRNENGYENVVIIAVGQSNISGFNNSFCSNSNLPLVMDQYPALPIRDQFSPYGQHKQIVILDYDGNYLGSITLSNGLNTTSKNYIRNLISENYEQVILGDVNGDTILNVQDIILLVNIILGNQMESDVADLNVDGSINVLDVIELVNLILN